jgi:hypothetical protein
MSVPLISREVGWECPCGHDPPKKKGAARPERTIVSTREPHCPFCGREYREEYCEGREP